MELSNLKVVHCKKEPYDVYIGRGSKWGNPFIMKNKTMEERQRVIEEYKIWITQGKGKYLLRHLNEIQGKTLGCWCAPLPCHGNILIELVNTYCHNS